VHNGFFDRRFQEKETYKQNTSRDTDTLLLTFSKKISVKMVENRVVSS